MPSSDEIGPNAIGPTEVGPTEVGPTEVGPTEVGTGRPRHHDAGADPPIRIRDPGELIAAVPALMGFHPVDSLVLIATGGATGCRLGLTLRVDLPAREHTDIVAADVVDLLLRDALTGVVLIVISRSVAGLPPRPDLVDRVICRLRPAGIKVHSAIWAESITEGVKWACYAPCTCTGRIQDPGSTVLAAATVASGQVIHTDRAGLEQVVAAAAPALMKRRERALAARFDAAVRNPGGGATDPAAGIALIDSAIAAATDGPELSEQGLIDLGWALGDIVVRDAALLRNLGPDAAAAERLWARLARELPDPEAAEPAALLAVAALLRGHGALANVALDRAERAWPGHRLTGLLRQVAAAALRPEELRGWLGSVQQASDRLPGARRPCPGAG